MNYQNKKILVLGMARSGYEVAKLLAQNNNKIIVSDAKEQNQEHVQELETLGVKVIITNQPEELIDETVDVLVKNPGIHSSHKCVQKAKELNIPVVNEVEVAYHFLPDDVKIIGITGSNGKTTTTTILYNILESFDLPVKLGGNIGIPLSAIVSDIKKGDILLLEVSSHQLVDLIDFKTDISVLLNLTETHLDFFDSYEIYKKNKLKIFNHHTNSDLAILNYDDSEVMEFDSNIRSTKKYFSIKREAFCGINGNFICYDNKPVVGLSSIRVQGEHNYQNIAAAIMVAKEFNVSDEVIVEELKKFSGVEHRLEYVRKLNDREFFNDSKSTNVKSTQTALKSIVKPTILILGGKDRDTSFDELTDYLTNTKLIVCFGETKDKIVEFSKRIGMKYIDVDNLTEAVKVSYNFSDPGDVVLLSPACASWDQFKDFEERGNEFKRIVENLE